MPSIDLFASRLNAQITSYVSWQPDPSAKFIDALSINWRQFKLLYAFPPFSLIANCLQKLDLNVILGIFVLPLWPTQPWFTRALLLPQRADLLCLPNSQTHHPLAKKMRLMALKLSSNHSEQEAFRPTLSPSFSTLGARGAESSTEAILNDGFNFVVKGRLIQLEHL